MGIKLFGDLFLHPPHCSLVAIGVLELAITILQKNGNISETVHKQATKGTEGCRMH